MTKCITLQGDTCSIKRRAGNVVGISCRLFDRGSPVQCGTFEDKALFPKILPVLDGKDETFLNEREEPS